VIIYPLYSTKPQTTTTPQSLDLPLHQVGPVTLAEGERGSEVLRKVGDGLDGLEDGLVNLLLVGSASLRESLLLLLGSTVKELLLVALLGFLLLSEVGIVELGNIDTGDVELGGGGNDIAGVNAANGDTVNFEGTSDEENTLVEVLEENDTLAAVTTGEDDEDGAGDKGRAEDGLALGLAGLLGDRSILSGVPLASLLTSGGDVTSARPEGLGGGGSGHF